MNKTAAICNVLALNTALACTVAPAQDVSFIARRDFAAGVGPISIAVGDFNRDGVPDLAVGDENLGEISVLLGNGDGTFQPAMSFAAGGIPRSLAVGDFNGDGVQAFPTEASDTPWERRWELSGGAELRGWRFSAFRRCRRLQRR